MRTRATPDGSGGARRGRLGIVSRLFSPLVVLFALGCSLLLVGGCESPPQILDIQPGRGAQNVPSSQVIRVKFDRAVDTGSIALRFSLRPAVKGTVEWEGTDQLVFRHEPLQPATDYEVALDPGYRDARGNANGLRHSWRFRSEEAPSLRGTTPASGDSGVDPATYVSLQFSRPVDPSSFATAITFEPAAAYAVRSDPGDASRLIVAPRRLLDPGRAYLVTLGTGARDIDGNAIAATRIQFTTGAMRSITRWITFVASNPARAGGDEVWMVDQQGFPRKLEDGPVAGFTAGAGGRTLLIRAPDDSWTAVDLGAGATQAGFMGGWAAGLGPGGGFIYLDAGRLVRRWPAGDEQLIADFVVEAVLAPDSSRLYFTVDRLGSGTIYGYDLSLRARYSVSTEPAPIHDLRPSPGGAALAYTVEQNGNRALRVKRLLGAGSVLTIATGDIRSPQWISTTDLVFEGIVSVGQRDQHRLFRVPVGAPLGPGALTLAASLAPGVDIDMAMPQPSGDGHEVAFLAGGPKSAQVWVMNADGTGVRRLTAFDSETFPYSCRDLHWAGPSI